MIGVLIMIPVGLIVIQPDFGTAMVLFTSILAMIFVWGIDVKFIKYSIISFIFATPLVYFFLLKPGQKERILVFLDPLRDPSGSGYHVLQSKLAIGAGGLGGLGMFNGVQTQMGYLYAQTTDFIFSAIAEEMGFFVAALLVILLIALVIFCLSVANTARDEEGKLIVVGLSIMFAVHIIINIGMTMGLMPITGIPLPFVSYGGSSMLTNMVAIGMILGVGLRKTGLRF
jgi:rod shape determining protein RodA